ncbi:MAG TPA: SIS domain-containing protein, partial [Methylomirabilota bacterium]|nr:SIS domain-containing protein [Methylomirabilota bacterium]
MTSPAQAYLAHARRLVDTVSAQEPLLGQAADWFAQTILAGRMVHVFGSGHS